MLLNCNRAVTIRTVLDIPSVLVHLDRVFSLVPIVVIIWMMVFSKASEWLLFGWCFSKNPLWLLTGCFTSDSEWLLFGWCFFAKLLSDYYLDGGFLMIPSRLLIGPCFYKNSVGGC